MSRHLVWMVLNDGVCELLGDDAVDPSEEAAVIDRALIPLTHGERGRIGARGGPYSVTGTISGKRTLLRVWDECAPLADVGICLHSRAAPGLWDQLRAGDAGELADIELPSAEPWCAVRCYAPEHVLPPWFDAWTKCAGMAVMRREGW